MKITTSLLLAVCLTLFLSSFGQKSNNLNSQGGETYFSFKVTSKEELKSLTHQISIDNYRNDTVWAYANNRQLQKFSSAGYKINILSHPGDGPGVVMRDQIKLLKGTKTTWNFYPTYDAYVALMTDFQAMYPDLCHIETITTLPSGRKILVAKISDNVTTDEAEPEFLYTSSMHGDETTGYVLMLQLIEYLLQNYGTNPEATDLVNNMEIYINPLANPDGTYYGGNNSVSGARRYNINGVDLNRNYPDPEDGDHPDGEAWQPETVAFMNFAGQHDFVAAANFHGGVEVVNYPWDTWATRSADDDWWQFVSREYADTVHLHSPSTYMDYLNNGVTNGYDWYEVAGGRQDYMNYFHHCREVTLEISDVKLLPAAQLPAHWNYNFRSLILYMKQSTYGFHGLITDQVTGNPVEAKVLLTGHDALNTEVYSTLLNGDYYRPVKAGTYTLEISAPCYLTQTFSNQTITDYSAFLLNVQLVPGTGVTTTVVTEITSNNATSGGNVICEGSSPVTARGVCWSSLINPTIAGQHTTDGSGAGAFVSYISGLSSNSTYYVRAYATNVQGTVYGENISFTTGCGATSLPFTENFTGSSFPLCWSTSVTGTGVVPNWSISNTTNAGGSAREMKSTYQNINPGTTRLVTPPLNTTGQSLLNLSFRHMLDAYGTGATLKIQSSTDGINWTDEAWSVAATSANIAATTVNTTIIHNLNSPSTLIAFTITGNLYQYDYWYIDNVSISGTSSNLPAVTTTVASQVTQNSAVSGGVVTSGGASGVTARGICWGTATNPDTNGLHTSDGTGTGTFISMLNGLDASTTYHIRAYATNSFGTSYGNDLSFSTSCASIFPFSWIESFENGGAIPPCWTQEEVNSSGLSWTFITGNGSGHPTTAHTGIYNACLQDVSPTDNKTLLVTPPLDLSSIVNPNLQFWHTQALWSPDQDELKVYYKTSVDGTWILLATYSDNITTWTVETLWLPEKSDDFYIGFEGNAKYGYGVCLDDVQITGTPATLLVTPQNQNVGAAAGTIEYSIESNSAWTAASNQTWCNVTPAGNGDGIISAVYDANTSEFARIAEITVTVNGIEPVLVTLTQQGLQEKQLNLTLFLEGLFNGSAMNKAQNENGDQFADNIADEIQVELHEATEPYLIAGGPYTAALRTDGTAQLSVPASLNMDYFIVIKHRNSLETWSSSPVSFSGTSISYNFTSAASQAFGSNLKPVSGVFVIYGGDVNQDGVVDSADMTPVDNDAAGYLAGYLSTDVNGDGIIDTADITIIDNNSASYTGVIAP
ncbi:MAG: hypothetical protein IPH20_14625 [Bacteroidales bacterium]|nr:hypothetical protein [Bacteroidales bacterium]